MCLTFYYCTYSQRWYDKLLWCWEACNCRQRANCPTLSPESLIPGIQSTIPSPLQYGPPTATTELAAKDMDHKVTVCKHVGDLLFDYQAGSFFQITTCLRSAHLIQYVCDAILPSTTASASSTSSPTHFVDAYCGAGLFMLTLTHTSHKSPASSSLQT